MFTVQSIRRPRRAEPLPLMRHLAKACLDELNDSRTGRTGSNAQSPVRPFAPSPCRVSSVALSWRIPTVRSHS